MNHVPLVDRQEDDLNNTLRADEEEKAQQLAACQPIFPTAMGPFFPPPTGQEFFKGTDSTVFFSQPADVFLASGDLTPSLVFQSATKKVKK